MLAQALRDVLGPDRVFTHPADLLAYEYDGSVLASIPDLVAFPTSTEELSGIVRAAARFSVPVVARAGPGPSYPSFARTRP